MLRLFIAITFILNMSVTFAVTEYVAQNKSGYTVKVKDLKKLLDLFSKDEVNYLSEGKVYALSKSMPKNKLKVLKSNSCIALGNKSKMSKLLKVKRDDLEFSVDHVYERPNRGGWAIIAYFKGSLKSTSTKLNFVVSCQKEEMKQFFKWTEFQNHLKGLLTFEPTKSSETSYF